MNDTYSVFEWSLDQENKIVEEIPISRYESYLSENGTIVEEILLACMIKSVEQKSDFFAFDTTALLDSFTDDYINELKEGIIARFHNKDLTKENHIAINFDILEDLAFNYVFAVCSNSPQGTRRSRETDKVIEILNEIINIAFTVNNDNEIHLTQTLHHSYTREYGLGKFRELIDEIKKTNIKKSYIKFGRKRKCIALYKKWAGQETTIAFSGYYDCISDDLYNYFGVKNENRRYEDYRKIADAIGAQLAGTSYSVSRYMLTGANTTTVERYDPIEDIMNRCKTDSDYYSCCERKIFAFLDNRDGLVYSGKLFVKYFPCEECAFSILHHITLQGKLFSMFVGLPG